MVGGSDFRARIIHVIEARRTQYAITALIVANAVIIGCETSPAVMARAGDLLVALDRLILAVFVGELLIKLWAYRGAFFRNGWNLFDAFVIGISLVPASEGASVLRALRIIRAMRLISVVPSMRKVTQALIRAVPGMGAVISLLALVFYVSSVMATKLFGAAFPDWFGNLGLSAFTLFQIMTLESWSMGIVRPVMTEFPYAWVFFVPFILVVTFAVLNLFIAIVVNAMHDEAQAAANEAEAEQADEGGGGVLAAVERLEHEVRALRAQIAASVGETHRETTKGGG
ncbi:MAG: ion transporter [Rhodospirillales bacterium]